MAQRTMPMRRRASARTRRGIMATFATFALVFGAFAVNPAHAADYPTWDELQAAKNNTAAAKDRVDEIKGLIIQLESEVAYAQQQARLRGEELQIANQKYDDATRIASDLASQAEESATKAAEADRQAGQLAAQLYRAGGADLSVNLFLEAGSEAQTDELLAKLGSMDKMAERTSEIYAAAETARKTAASLSEQADVARGEREKLRIAAEEALIAAQEAQAAAESALAASEDKRVELEEQVKFLEDTEAKTAAAYQAGVEERARLERERIAREREAAAAAIANGQVANSGWARPASGWITGSYGPRASICTAGGCSNSFHYAIDLGTGCSAPIYAAGAGRVTYAGWYGTYGNYVKIDHGGGISTGYAHIRPGGTFVGYGQYVGAGELIASSGTTGASTGCHLHFEVWHGWNRISPLPFMADRGVYW